MCTENHCYLVQKHLWLYPHACVLCNDRLGDEIESCQAGQCFLKSLPYQTRPIQWAQHSYATSSIVPKVPLLTLTDRMA
jgi:hypothetical protein